MLNDLPRRRQRAAGSVVREKLFPERASSGVNDRTRPTRRTRMQAYLREGRKSNASSIRGEFASPPGGASGLAQRRRVVRESELLRGEVPVVIDDDGFLMGLWPKVSEIIEGGRKVTVAQQEIAGVTYSSDWFQYCGVQTYPGVKPLADQDNYFRYANNPPYKWQKEEVSPGAKVHIDDFEDYVTWGNSIGKAGVGKPAFATWRSQDVPPQVQMPVQLIRSTIVDNLISNAQGETKQWLQESCSQGFIAILDKCTHFCCVPGFKSFTDSEKFDGADLIYCQCHQSVYDPFSIIKDRFVALPRNEE